MLEFSPLSAFSSNDLHLMDKEVEDACSEGDEMSTGNTETESSDDSNDENVKSEEKRSPKRIKERDQESSSDENSDFPKGWGGDGKRDSKRVRSSQLDKDEEDTRESFAENRMRDDSSDDCNDASISSFDEEIAAAVEREFLR